MKYTSSTEDINPENLNGFFVGWPNPPSTQTFLKILKQSHEVVLAVDDATDNVVGFINAISDGILSAYIPLLEVLPEYKGRGIGSELVTRMLRKLDGLYMIDLVCDQELQAFYTKIGLKPGFAMMIRNFKKQSGK
ncbi:MAG: GNAT family N-acetyltransferase [candidate division Zixibacteria bacterium]|nr:GNAT family N-acetyltransferase [candidate division Zixibacteria bacterium]NIR63522.1 GNAT family N-acetyltransferase [candidate division Zixibacteria bacterium]NIS17956.1 GNAT family N-acetyltransferase [candidate division Zixibacteria bacterium]NIS46232.1 GNAT family N-acetyltransferase [candidate division Zixibacteria bacterium]NIT54239.1 GNAT family N-acetyltransferase [candidate division Zixibacteria bacterium]